MVQPRLAGLDAALCDQAEMPIDRRGRGGARGGRQVGRLAPRSRCLGRPRCAARAVSVRCSGKIRSFRQHGLDAALTSSLIHLYLAVAISS